ncbi:probable zinc metallopeptidase EGY3, chloroplastic [Olea europaea subsp. europaea]|uniref:Probable zinc metallopeptidase EGY3, chloroplastic n=1 Tax=Olea europaea subsp. europaea TaxID=158383 RepID=A0A8S0RDG8_OLEEU|nr:probable zinc metallopeptidase EGY3, chloroplastic [Olea europaea subsp. europaea]
MHYNFWDLTSGFFVKPDATINGYLNDVVPLFIGFLTIVGVFKVCCEFFRLLY